MVYDFLFKFIFIIKINLFLCLVVSLIRWMFLINIEKNIVSFINNDFNFVIIIE